MRYAECSVYRAMSGIFSGGEVSAVCTETLPVLGKLRLAWHSATIGMRVKTETEA